MKKTICLILSVLLFFSLAIPAMAADVAVAFTSDSGFTVGDTVKVDDLKTRQNIIDLGKDSAEYNACIEGFLQYYWFRNDSYYADGTTLTLTENDKGCEFYCQVYLFSDVDRTQQCGVYESAKFTVPNTNNAIIPDITTKELINGMVGEEYYQRLTCTDDDVVYTLFRSSLPDGLYLTQHGEIEGTPTKAGSWYVVIMVTPEAGEDYANTKEFEITVVEKQAADEPPQITTTSLADAIVGEEYSATLSCTDADADFSIYYNLGKSNDFEKTGLTLTQYGEIKGTPTSAGTYTFTICASGEGGEGYMTYTLAINEAETEPDDELEDSGDPLLPDEMGTTSAPDDESESTEPDENGNSLDSSDITESSESKSNDKEDKSDGLPWWGTLLIALAAAGAGVGITVLVLKKKK